MISFKSCAHLKEEDEKERRERKRREKKKKKRKGKREKKRERKTKAFFPQLEGYATLSHVLDFVKEHPNHLLIFVSIKR